MGVSCSFIHRSWMTGFCTILKKKTNILPWFLNGHPYISCLAHCEHSQVCYWLPYAMYEIHGACLRLWLLLRPMMNSIVAIVFMFMLRLVALDTAGSLFVSCSLRLPEFFELFANMWTWVFTAAATSSSTSSLFLPPHAGTGHDGYGGSLNVLAIMEMVVFIWLDVSVCVCICFWIYELWGLLHTWE